MVEEYDVECSDTDPILDLLLQILQEHLERLLRRVLYSKGSLLEPLN
jgi:hypothetical protein